jgi:hypothetical protein
MEHAPVVTDSASTVALADANTMKTAWRIQVDRIAQRTMIAAYLNTVHTTHSRGTGTMAENGRAGSLMPWRG